MSNYVSGPTTFEQVRWSAHAFRGSADDSLATAVREPQFADAIRRAANDADWTLLVRYVNQWSCRIPQDKIPGIAAAVREATPYVEALSGSSLEFDDLRCSTLDVVERAFDCLTTADGVGPTAASAILTALHPGLFVSWGAGIRKAYFPEDKASGATYAQFLTVMRMAALSLSTDARSEHGIDDPAGVLSGELGIDPPFSLAKFIDEYNWLTLERQEEYSGQVLAV